MQEPWKGSVLLEWQKRIGNVRSPECLAFKKAVCLQLKQGRRDYLAKAAERAPSDPSHDSIEMASTTTPDQNSVRTASVPSTAGDPTMGTHGDSEMPEERVLLSGDHSTSQSSRLAGTSGPVSVPRAAEVEKKDNEDERSGVWKSKDGKTLHWGFKMSLNPRKAPSDTPKDRLSITLACLKEGQNTRDLEPCTIVVLIERNEDAEKVMNGIVLHEILPTVPKSGIWKEWKECMETDASDESKEFRDKLTRYLNKCRKENLDKEAERDTAEEQDTGSTGARTDA